MADVTGDGKNDIFCYVSGQSGDGTIFEKLGAVRPVPVKPGPTIEQGLDAAVDELDGLKSVIFPADGMGAGLREDA